MDHGSRQDPDNTADTAFIRMKLIYDPGCIDPFIPL